MKNERPAGERCERVEMGLRPLTGVSDFVVEQMPGMLTQVRSGALGVDVLALEAQKLVEGLSSGTIERVLNIPDMASLASLDLKMLEAAIAHSGGNVPCGLSQMVDVFSNHTDQPGGITYEEIVMINPSSDMRLFTEGETGKTERTFYEMHADIEGHLDESVAVAVMGIDTLATQGVEKAEYVAEELNQSAVDLAEIVRHTHSLGEQSAKHFGEFRGYLGTHPIRQTKGPSGAFTAGIPILEILIAKDRLPEDYTQYLEANRQYFPRVGRNSIVAAQELAADGNSLIVLCEEIGNPPYLAEAINRLSEFLRRFRGEHYRAVRKQVPEALDGQSSGTGGEADPGEFLRNRMRIRHTI